MAQYAFTFTDDLDKKSIVIESSYRGADLKKFIQKTIKTNTEKLNDFLSHFGRTYFEVENKDTRRKIATGNYTVNVFAGRADLEFKVISYNLG